MKKVQIRQGVFETNSSSTHSICIAKNTELIIPKEIRFEFIESAWSFETFHSLGVKAGYLYTGLVANDRKEDIEKIFKILRGKGVEVTAEEIGDDTGYIDHYADLTEFLDSICNDEDKLMNYLFSPLSFIITGNDNDDDDVSIKVEYPHDEYYKGN